MCLPLEKEMATHSIILAWEIPWTEEPGRLQSMGSQKSWTQAAVYGVTKELDTTYWVNSDNIFVYRNSLFVKLFLYVSICAYIKLSTSS